MLVNRVTSVKGFIRFYLTFSAKFMTTYSRERDGKYNTETIFCGAALPHHKKFGSLLNR